ncbi:mitotic fidelity of chromosome transmission- protein [Microbotryomycetes sp. JL221]|nr:mitotic fidelity of chromosome transmission- protein [Microbotryomycetes sp. JL221]
MGPPTPGRDRGAREQRYNDIGNEGRITGVRPPTNAPRDSAGNEHPSAYFDESDEDQQGARVNSRRNNNNNNNNDYNASLTTTTNASKSAQKRKQNSSTTKSTTRVAPGSSQQGPQRRDRPDMYADYGERGRKTGVRVAMTQRDQDDFEGVDNFFHTSPNSTTSRRSRRGDVTSPNDNQQDEDEDEDGPVQTGGTKSSIRKGRKSIQRLPSPVDWDANREFGGGGEEEDYDESDMQLDDGTSMTPSAYQRAQARTNKSARRITTNGRGNANHLDDDQNEQATIENSDDQERTTSHQRVRKGPPGRKVSLGETLYGQDQHGEQDDDDLGSRSSTRKQQQTRRRSTDRTLSLPSPKGKFDSRARQIRANDEEEHEEEQQHSEDDQGNDQADFGQEDYGDVSMQLNDIPEENEDGSDAEQGQRQDDSDTEDENDEPRQTKFKGKGRASVSNNRRATSKSTSNDARQRSRKATSGQPQAIVTNYSRKRPAEDTPDGVRRSARNRLSPLDYWRNERIVYKRRESGLGIEQVVRIPKERSSVGPPSLQHRHKRSASHQPKRSGSRVKSEVPEEEGVDDATDPDGIVWSWEGNAEVSRRIAFTSKMIDPKPTYNNKFAFQKIFTELDYLAGGVLVIPVGAEKPSKPARDNSYVFYCIEGSVSVVVHRTRFSIGPGGTFFVPRGNNYSITATSNRDVKLFFTQGRRVIEEPDGNVRQDTLEDSRRVSQSQQQQQQRQQLAENDDAVTSEQEED